MKAVIFLYLFFAVTLMVAAIDPSLWVGFIMISTLVTISIVERRIEE